MSITSTSSSSRDGPTNIFTFSPRKEEMRSRQSSKSDPLGLNISPNFGMSITPSSTINKVLYPQGSSNIPLEELRGSFTSNRQSILDYPGSAATSKYRMVQSPAAMSLTGMTPLSNIKDTFSATPFSGEPLCLFSPSNNDRDDVKANLFYEPQKESAKRSRPTGGATLSVKTTSSSKMDVTSNHKEDDKKCRQVAISPISQNPSVERRRGSFFSKSRSSKSCHESQSLGTILAQVSLTASMSVSSSQKLHTDRDELDMPPPSSIPNTILSDSRDDSMQMSCTKSRGSPMIMQTSDQHPHLDISNLMSPRNVTHDECDTPRNMSAPSPFPTPRMMDGLPTPGSGEDGDRFWSNDLGFDSFSPFKSPSQPNSTKARQAGKSLFEHTFSHLFV
jgi:hypothetical protein